jgi:signal transduction histidine kinase
MKNPLMAIREFSRTIKDELDPESHLVEFLDLIYTSTDQMLHLVTHLLDSAALESGQLQLHKELIDLGQLATTVAYRNQKQAEAKQQRIAITTPDQAPLMVAADPAHLYDALENLISNAIKYSPMGKTIWVNARDRNGMACVSVRDEGPGLTNDDKKKLFGKFQKLSAQPTGNEPSSGLGLSIVKQIMELHDGHVWAESTGGRGSTFLLALPYAEPRKPINERDAQAPPRRPNSGTHRSEA